MKNAIKKISNISLSIILTVIACFIFFNFDSNALSSDEKPYFCNVTFDKEGQILGDGDTFFITCEVANCETPPESCKADINTYSGWIFVDLYYNTTTDKYEGSYTLGDTYDNPVRACYITEISCNDFRTFFNESLHPFGEFSFIYNNNCKNGIHYPETSQEKVESTCAEIGYSEEIKCSLCDTVITERASIQKKEHTVVTVKAVSATCTANGLSEGSYCSVCNAAIKKQTSITKLPHTYKKSTTKATLSKNGSVVTACSVCGAKKSTTTIYYPKKITLSTTTYTYNGKTKTPSVTVKDSKGKALKKNTDYTVKYPKGRKSIGKYTVTVTFKGNYSGTKKLTFEIVPAKVTLSKLTTGSKQLTATWKSVSGITGYEVQYSTSKKFTSKTTKIVKIKSAKTKKTTIKKLKKGKKYYIRICAYKTVNKKPIYGAWSTVKSVKVK